MRRSRQIAVGGVALIGGQLCIAVLQILYSGFSSRVLAPSAFGAFSVAISATGLAALLLTTGLAAYVVSRPELNPSMASALWLLSWLAGLAGALVLFALAPLWVAAWNASAAVPLTRLLALQVLLASPAAVQSAFLRREGRPAADAGTQVASAATGMVVGAILIAMSRDDLALAVSPTVAAGVALVVAASLRRHRFRIARPGSFGSVLRFSWRVSTQNIVFFVLLSLPVWAVSVGAGVSELGQFSRAALVTGLPSTAIATALTRALQPFYRHMETRELQRRAVTDAVAVTSLIVFPAFAGMAAVGPALVDVWLGPGWSLAGGLVAPLAIGYGLYVVYTVLANASETLSEFSPVRNSQIAMAFPGLLLVAAVILSHAAQLGAWIMLAISVCGTIALVLGLEKVNVVHGRELAATVVKHGVWSLLVAVAAWSAQLAVGAIGETSSVWQLTIGTAVGGIFALALLRRQPGWRVLVSRGILDGRSRVKRER